MGNLFDNAKVFAASLVAVFVLIQVILGVVAGFVLGIVLLSSGYANEAYITALINFSNGFSILPIVISATVIGFIYAKKHNSKLSEDIGTKFFAILFGFFAMFGILTLIFSTPGIGADLVGNIISIIIVLIGALIPSGIAYILLKGAVNLFIPKEFLDLKPSVIRVALAVAIGVGLIVFFGILMLGASDIGMLLGFVSTILAILLLIGWEVSIYLKLK